MLKFCASGAIGDAGLEIDALANEERAGRIEGETRHARDGTLRYGQRFKKGNPVDVFTPVT
jgi:hypothetical protein